MRFQTSSAALAALAVIAAPRAAHATINSASVSGTAVIISGLGFGTARAPTVTLGATAVAVSSYTTTSISGTVPATPAAGSHRLSVQTWISSTKANTEPQYEVTVGAVGPAGPPGPQGVQGPPGRMPSYAQVIVVDRSGTEFADPVAALASIADASAAKPYLLKIMPGIYPLSSPLRLKAFVDVEGSGQNVTVLDGSPTAVAVQGTNASNLEVRDLTIRTVNATSPGGQGVAIQGGAPRFTRVTVDFSGFANTMYAVMTSGARAAFGDVTIRARGGDGAGADNTSLSGFQATQSSPQFRNVSVDVRCGVDPNTGIAGNSWGMFLSGGLNGEPSRLDHVTVRVSRRGPVALFCASLRCEIADSDLEAVADPGFYAAAILMDYDADVAARRSRLASVGYGYSPAVDLTSGRLAIDDSIVSSAVNGFLLRRGSARLRSVEVSAPTPFLKEAAAVACRDVFDPGLATLTCP